MLWPLVLQLLWGHLCCRWGVTVPGQGTDPPAQQHPEAAGCRREQNPAITASASLNVLSAAGQSSCLCPSLIWGAQGAIFPLESNTSRFPWQPNGNFKPFCFSPAFQTFADREPWINPQAFWVLDYTLSQSFLWQQCWNWHGMLILLYLFTQSERKMHESKLLVQAKFRFIQLELIIIFI